MYFINNKKTIYDTFFDILIYFDFDSTGCENEFRKCMNALKFDINFFDIYGFFSLDINTDVQLVKSNYNEFKNNLTNNNNSNNEFTIFLELIGFDKNTHIKNLINNSINQNRSTHDNYNKYIQLKIISSIEKILSNNELKNIYDEYYLDYNINYIQSHKHKSNTNKKKLDLINTVYSNLFIKPSILIEKYDVNKLDNLYQNLKLVYKFDVCAKTPEELEEIYNLMNKPKYSIKGDNPQILNINMNPINLSDEIRKHMTQISHIQIDHTEMDFLNKIIIKYEIDSKYSMNLINYYKYKMIHNDPTGNKYNKYYFDDEYLLVKNHKNDDNFIKEFVDNFDIGNFFEFIKSTKSNKKNNISKKTNNKEQENENEKEQDNDYEKDYDFELELKKMINKRNEQNETIKNNIDNKLEYYAHREFTIQEIWNECDYSKTFDFDKI